MLKLLLNRDTYMPVARGKKEKGVQSGQITTVVIIVEGKVILLGNALHVVTILSDPEMMVEDVLAHVLAAVAGIVVVVLVPVPSQNSGIVQEMGIDQETRIERNRNDPVPVRRQKVGIR